MSRKSANSSTKEPKIACKRSFSSFTNENTLQDYEVDNVFGFMDDSDKVGQKELPIDNFPIHDLTENPTYLMEFGFGNGFVWNEEVLLSPPFSSSTISSDYPQSQQSSSNSRQMHSSSYQSNRSFPSVLAEKLRRKRISEETKVEEIRID